MYQSLDSASETAGPPICNAHICSPSPASGRRTAYSFEHVGGSRSARLSLQFISLQAIFLGVIICSLAPPLRHAAAPTPRHGTTRSDALQISNETVSILAVRSMLRNSAKDIAQSLKGLAQLAHGSLLETRSASLTLRANTSSSAGPSSQPQASQHSTNRNMGQKGAEFLKEPAVTGGFSAVPQMPKFLGLAGAIPFLALSPPIAAGIPIMPADLVASAALLQVGYGATIASFLGGIHWALAMADYGSASQKANSERYLWSVTPCLMAWPAIIMQPGPASLVVASTLGVVYAVDKSFAKRGLLPNWYMALRLPLTLAAVGGLAITCVNSLTNNVPIRGPAVIPESKKGDIKD